MQQLEHFPENIHSPAAMAPADMTVPEWQLRARLKWLLQQQDQYQLSFLTATTPTAIDLRRPINNTLSVLPAGTAAPLHTCSNAFNMPPDHLIQCPVFGTSFVSGGEGASVEPGMSRFSCPPPAVEEGQMKATVRTVAASPFDVVRGGAATAAAAPYHTKVDGSGRDQSSRKRKAAHEAITEERPEVDNGYDLDAMIVPKLETDPPISRSVTTTADGSDGTSRENCTKDVSDHTAAAKTGYIQVRARRGEATDSHSLAERARREKISKRMKLLQELVPGCSRITGKAGVLDEIINYVQSLQRQVEFLSMKLAAVDPILDSDIDTFLSKEVMQMLNPHHGHGGLLPSSAGSSTTPPLELQLDASFLINVNTMQTVQQAVAAPTAVDHCSSSSLVNEVAFSSSCPGKQASLLHDPTDPRAPPVALLSEGCLVMDDPYKVHALAATTSLWEADLHNQYYRMYE